MEMNECDEEIIALANRLKDPTYQPTEEEQITILVTAGHIKLLRLPISVQPERPREPWFNELTSTFNLQKEHVRSRILLYRDEFMEEWVQGRLDEAIKRRMAGINIHNDIVICCLIELQTSDRLHEEAFYLYHKEFYPYQPPPRFDPKALIVEKQAAERGAVIVIPNTDRGSYAGRMVGRDYRSGLIEFARGKCIILPFKELAEGQYKPAVGDMVRMEFKSGSLTVFVSP